jgi:hypothetical protein
MGFIKGNKEGIKRKEWLFVGGTFQASTTNSTARRVLATILYPSITETRISYSTGAQSPLF